MSLIHNDLKSIGDFRRTYKEKHALLKEESSGALLVKGGPKETVVLSKLDDGTLVESRTRLDDKGELYQSTASLQQLSNQSFMVAFQVTVGLLGGGGISTSSHQYLYESGPDVEAQATHVARDFAQIRSGGEGELSEDTLVVENDGNWRKIVQTGKLEDSEIWDFEPGPKGLRTSYSPNLAGDQTGGWRLSPTSEGYVKSTTLAISRSGPKDAFYLVD